MPTRKKTVAVIGVPMDLGTHLRGVDMGPSAIRLAGSSELLASLGYLVHDRGNLHVPHARAPLAPVRRGAPQRQRTLLFAPLVQRVCKDLMRTVERALDEGAIPLVLGGDHSLAMGSLAGVARHARRTGRQPGLLWVDAHGDCNTPETSPSGNIHGMPLAVVLGHGARLLTRLAGFQPMLAPERTVLLGVRDLDSGERANVRRLGVHVVTMRQIDERGMLACMREALAIVNPDGGGFHLSFDLDSLDPSVAPGVGTPVSGGLTIREAHLLMELVADSGGLRSCDVVEVDPTLDQRNTTAQLAAQLVASAFGASIL